MGFMNFGRSMGYELGKAIARWEQLSNMSQQEYEKFKKAESARKRKEEEKLL